MSSEREVAAAAPEVLRPALELYLDLHRHPELSGAERRTAAAFADRLERAGFHVLRGIGGHGVVGILRSGTGPVVLLRAELDALPIAERTGLPYASEQVHRDGDGRSLPVMHACGHDAHLAACAGAAALLARRAADWTGTLVVVGQPAEETLAGARAMLADGLYDRVGVPDVVLAQHTAPLPAGMVAHGRGAVLAGSSTVRLVVHGRGGHVAVPHLAVNPIVVAAGIVLRLRELDGPAGLSVSVGALHAGERSNVVPDTATLEISLRSFSAAGLERAEQAVRGIAESVCTAAGCPAPPELTVLGRSPVTVTDPAAADPVRAAHERGLGPERVTGWPPSLATEDVGWLAGAGASLHGAAGIRLAHWMLGCVGPAQWAAAPGDTAAAKLAALPANHSPDFRVEPRLTLTTGITALALAALTHLGPGDVAT